MSTRAQRMITSLREKKKEKKKRAWEPCPQSTRAEREQHQAPKTPRPRLQRTHRPLAETSGLGSDILYCMKVMRRRRANRSLRRTMWNIQRAGQEWCWNLPH